ncbi:MAG TPA: imelysin family protein, partial [Myxococcaceae bacterium]|nr:imelysin family protein [Myxococcaceae bacterium]
VLSSHFKIDQSADLAGIDALLLGTAAVDEAAAKVLGANRKGLLAMEYLLFDPVGGNAAVLQTLQAAEGGERRRIYLRSLGRVMRSDVAELLAAWEPGGGNYASQISQAGQGSQAFGTQKTAVDALVNRLIFSAESAELKLSRPLGREAGGTPQPNQEEARFSDNSLRDLLEVLEGIRRVYVGPSESGSDVGLSDVLNSQNAELDARMVSELGAARQALSSVPAPLRTALSGSSAQVESARASLAALHATLATEVASNLGVTLKFNDNDGD